MTISRLIACSFFFVLVFLFSLPLFSLSLSHSSSCCLFFLIPRHTVSAGDILSIGAGDADEDPRCRGRKGWITEKGYYLSRVRLLLGHNGIMTVGFQSLLGTPQTRQ